MKFCIKETVNPLNPFKAIAFKATKNCESANQQLAGCNLVGAAV